MQIKRIRCPEKRLRRYSHWDQKEKPRSEHKLAETGTYIGPISRCQHSKICRWRRRLHTHTFFFFFGVVVIYTCLSHKNSSSGNVRWGSKYWQIRVVNSNLAILMVLVCDGRAANKRKTQKIYWNTDRTMFLLHV